MSNQEEENQVDPVDPLSKAGDDQINSIASLNHHFDTLKPDYVIDVKNLKDEDIEGTLMFIGKGSRTVVITQLTSEKARYFVKNWKTLFDNKKIVNLYFDPYNDEGGMCMSLIGLTIELGKCCKTTPLIANAYFIIREGTYCRIN
jgi:hypothetical protein